MSKVINQSHNGNIIHDIDFSATSLTSIDTDGVIEFYSNKGAVIHTAEVNKVLDFIETHSLNIDHEYGGNSGIGEPWNDLPDAPVEVDPMDYLDATFLAVTQLYYMEIVHNAVEKQAIALITNKLNELDKEDQLAIKDGDLNKSFLLSSIKCTLMDLRLELSQLLGLTERRAA